jgi:hypothetical protein
MDSELGAGDDWSSALREDSADMDLSAHQQQQQQQQ